jgi:DNA-binding CsgD family transcriptional regulator
MTGFSVDSFIQQSATVNDLRDLVRLFEEVCAALGFDTISYHLVRRSFRSLPATEGARASGNPEKLAALFEDGRSIDSDPAVSELLDSLKPFHWFASEQSPRISHAQKKVLEALREDGFIDGICVPIVTRPGELVLFAFSKRGSTYAFSDIELRKLQMACHAMHMRFEELLDGNGDLLLSARETDVMRLVARGKTNKEIAIALKLSVHTVDTLIRRCFTKLGVTNRIEASIMFTFRDKLSA